MILTIWRHGQAGSAASDRLRELTQVGRADIAAGWRQLCGACDSHSIPRADLVLHSAWLRTTQTAEIIAAGSGSAPRRCCDALLPDGHSPRAVDDALATLGDSGDAAQHLVLVSHQPLVSALADHYLGERGRVPALPPGGLVTLQLDVPARACARLLFWCFPPAYEVAL